MTGDPHLAPFHQNRKTTLNRLLSTGLGILLSAAALPGGAAAQSITVAYPATPDYAGLRALVQDALRDLLKKEPELITNAMRDGQAKEAANTQAANAQAAVQTAAKLIGDPLVPSIGPAKGKPVVEFFDYNCPHCKRFAQQTFTPLHAARKDVRWLFVYAPILGPGSQRLALFAAAAQLQGKFEAAHAFLMGQQQSLGTLDAANGVRDALIKAAGLDPVRFDRAIESGEAQAIVDRGFDYARQARLTGTPLVIVGTTYIPGFVPPEVLGQQLP